MKKIYYLSTVFLTLLLIGATVSTTAQTLIQPTSTGIVWVQGTTHNITWSGDPSTSYKLYYKKNRTLERQLIYRYQVIHIRGIFRLISL